MGEKADGMKMANKKSQFYKARWTLIWMIHKYSNGILDFCGI
jgi:hypothetical protein